MPLTGLGMIIFGKNLLTGLPLLLCNTLLFSVAIAGLIFLNSGGMEPFWFLCGVLYASFIEYCMHRFLLHSVLDPVGRLHRAHHQVFQAPSMRYHSRQEWHLILFSPFTSAIIIGVAASHFVVLRAVGLPRIGCGVSLALLVYFFFYEWLHLACHSRITMTRWCRPLRILRHHHLVHHSVRYGLLNFNVVLPLIDNLEGIIRSFRVHHK